LRKLLTEIGWLAAGMIGLGALIKILLPLSSINAVARLTLGIFWLFALPGWCITLPWRNEFELKERLVVGILAAGGLFAITSYYLGLLGIHVRTHALLLPAVTIALSCAIYFWSSGKAPKKPQ
jgi:uncharacterized membrane protein